MHQPISDIAFTPAVKQALLARIAAFKSVLAIEQARDLYVEEHSSLPAGIDVLLREVHHVNALIFFDPIELCRVFG